MTSGVEPGGSCPRCGADYEPGQEYCLECGARLPVAGSVPSGVAAAWHRSVTASAAPWVGPVLAGLAIAAVMTAVAILIARGGETDDRAFINATMGGTLASPTVESLPPTTATTATTEPTTAATTTAPPRQELVEWPPSQGGYTVVIASLPSTTGRAFAVRKARQVLASGLPEVGVLDSGDFSSLHPGYYVVFSGIYENQREALGAAPRVQDLYPLAYIRQISR